MRQSTAHELQNSPSFVTVRNALLDQDFEVVIEDGGESKLIVAGRELDRDMIDLLDMEGVIDRDTLLEISPAPALRN
jgi:hypothetical protein